MRLARHNGLSFDSAQDKLRPLKRARKLDCPTAAAVFDDKGWRVPKRDSNTWNAGQISPTVLSNRYHSASQQHIFLAILRLSQSGPPLVTLRAFLIGLTLSIFSAIWPAWSSYIIDSSRADHAHLSAAILIPFLVLLLINTMMAPVWNSRLRIIRLRR